jgi:hypothetical protein
VSNVETVNISNNQFTRVSNVLITRYSAKGATPATGGRLPRSVLLQSNVIANAVWMNLEGRGTIGETITISGNQMLSSLRECRILPMSTAAQVSGEQTAGYPNVVLTNNTTGFNCRYK